MNKRRIIVDHLGALVVRASRLPLVTVVAIAILLRLVGGLAVSASSASMYEFGRLAENVVEGNGYSYVPADEDGRLTFEDEDQADRWLPSAQMPPAYTGVVVVGVHLGGDSHVDAVWIIRVFNLLFAALTVIAVHGLAYRLLGSRPAATLAALGSAVYPTAVYAATQVSAANFYIPVQMLALVALLAAVNRPGWRRWALAGASLGVLCLLRSEAALWILLAAAWLWWAASSVARGRRWKLLAAFTGAALLLPGAWVARNTVTFGRPAFAIATTGGSNLWIGNHPGASGSQKDFDIPGEITARLDALPPTDDYELRADDIFRREAVQNILDDPLATLARDGKKLVLLLGADVYDSRSLNPVYLGAWGVVALLGTRGLLDWWRAEGRSDRAARALVVGYLAVNAAVPVIFFALARFKLPIEIVLLVFAARTLAPGPDPGYASNASRSRSQVAM